MDRPDPAGKGHMRGVGVAQEAHAQAWISGDDGRQVLEVVRRRQFGHRPDSAQAGLGCGASRPSSRPQEELALEQVETQPPADLEGPAAVHAAGHQLSRTHALAGGSDERLQLVRRPSPDLDHDRMRPVEQRPVHRGKIGGVQREPEASHGVTVDGVSQVVVERLVRRQAEDDALVGQAKRAPLDELPARDTQENETAGSERMKLLGQHKLGVGALRHRSQIAAR